MFHCSPSPHPAQDTPSTNSPCWKSQVSNVAKSPHLVPALPAGLPLLLRSWETRSALVLAAPMQENLPPTITQRCPITWRCANPGFHTQGPQGPQNHRRDPTTITGSIPTAAEQEGGRRAWRSRAAAEKSSRRKQNLPVSDLTNGIRELRHQKMPSRACQQFPRQVCSQQPVSTGNAACVRSASAHTSPYAAP